MKNFRFIHPTLPPLARIVTEYREFYHQGLITNGKLVERLEAAVCERLGVRHCVAVSSCTSGLMLVMKAFGLRGEVILPSFTFFATGHAVLWNGLTPVFADCDRQTWNIDPRAVERAITPQTAAILAVHLYGNPAAVTELEWIAGKHGIPLLFDAAHAFGASYKGQSVGQFGDAEVFSLSPTKLLVAGEGGLVATNDALLAHKLRAGRNYGDLGAYDPMLLGLNARMTEFKRPWLSPASTWWPPKCRATTNSRPSTPRSWMARRVSHSSRYPKAISRLTKITPSWWTARFSAWRATNWPARCSTRTSKPRNTSILRCTGRRSSVGCHRPPLCLRRMRSLDRY
ncbi:MAG TPA: DegT/DnrJ/EryC1/StrS family aminotransferase [Bryobacteraceae bacterium]|nr:DegT/DnrJ/EryC1/StrS family aminotransferase [Bryobacteraceae bacterium]